MVDYTQQKLRSIIYRDRIELDEFDVDNEKSMDCFMLERIEKSPVIDMEDANRYILDLFNQVYYIITLILMEKRPVHYFKKYLAIASHTSSYYFNLSSNGSGAQIFECIVMAMVYNYLQMCSAPLGNNVKALLEKIFEHYQSFMVNNEMRAIFYKCIISKEEHNDYKVDVKVFEPLCRPTDEEAKTAPANQLEEQEQKYRKLANDYVELEKEMEELKSEVLTLKNEDTEKIRQENEALKEQVNKYEKNKTGMTLGLNQTQAALFGLALANSFGFNYRNKKELAPMIHELFGWGKSKIEKKLCEGFSKDDKEKLCTIFKTLSPTLCTMLMRGGEKK